MKGAKSRGNVLQASTLIVLARKGDDGARQDFARAFYNAVYRRVLAGEARGGSVSDAADITQATFERALASLGTYSGCGSVENWLFKIAGRVAADFYRSRATAPASPGSSGSSDEALGIEATTPLDAALEREEQRQVKQAFAQLSPDHREVLELRVLGGRSVSETAERMGRTQPAVKMLQLRATRALAAALAVGPVANTSSEGSDA